jgi:hypothetical protein
MYEGYESQGYHDDSEQMEVDSGSENASERLLDRWLAARDLAVPTIEQEDDVPSNDGDDDNDVEDEGSYHPVLHPIPPFTVSISLLASILPRKAIAW